jgi:hypothetical protein
VVFVSSATGCFFANIKLYRVEGLENYFCLRERLSRGELPRLSSQIDPPTAMAKAAKHRTEGFLQASRSVGR